ncbi:M56 family metallopeptidase [Myroides injenensis]|uniref:M56 family metallopeptidase n=1 Tax=Myroides injenensis TaxID=1183151 RepID=UPI0002899759|nr:M56 family metallopeptidase [Myroides injenensis]
MLLYLTKITIILSIALLLYKLLLEDTKAHHFKRYYLLGTLILGLLFPLITVTNVTLSTVTNTYTNLNEIEIFTSNTSEKTNINWTQIAYIVYIIGVVVTAVRFIISLYRLNKLKQKGILIKDKGYSYVLLNHLDNAFSFGKTIYLPNTIDYKSTNKIVKHEKAHISQLHSFDIIFIECLKIIFWFHPLFYNYKTCIALNHEFLADDASIDTKQEINDYLQILLHQTYKQNELALTSSFNFNLTKKRFIMITKKNSPYKNLLGITTSCMLFISIGLLTVNAQEQHKYNDSNHEKIYTAAEKYATYPGGMNAFQNEFVTKFILPETTNINDNIKVIVQFVVEKDGSLSNINILKDPGYNIGAQVTSTLTSMSRWVPAVVEGENVRSYYTLPITLHADNNSSK